MHDEDTNVIIGLVVIAGVTIVVYEVTKRVVKRVMSKGRKLVKVVPLPGKGQEKAS